MIRRLALTLVVILSVVGGGLGVAPAGPAEARACSWAGVWDAGVYGTLELEQTNDLVTGSYSYGGKSGRLSGKADADLNALGGEWTETPAPEGKDKGQFLFAMAADCNSFEGIYGYGLDPNADVAGRWDAKRVS